jgi:hypothetical protein
VIKSNIKWTEYGARTGTLGVQGQFNRIASGQRNIWKTRRCKSSIKKDVEAQNMKNLGGLNWLRTGFPTSQQGPAPRSQLFKYLYHKQTCTVCAEQSSCTENTKSVATTEAFYVVEFIFCNITACSPLKVNGRFGCYLPGFLLGLFFHPKDGGDIFLRNLG